MYMVIYDLLLFIYVKHFSEFREHILSFHLAAGRNRFILKNAAFAFGSIWICQMQGN